MLNRILKSIVYRSMHKAVKIRGHYSARLGSDRYKVNWEDWSFWRQASEGRWEPETFEFLKRYLSPNSTYIDVGAWIGPTVLFAARHSKQVICLEPDRFAYRKLLTNLELNAIDNVKPFNCALDVEFGFRRMASFGRSLGDSMTSLLAGGATDQTIEVFCFAVSEFFAEFGHAANVIKIDVEGAEFDLLPKLSPLLEQHRPVINLSLHPQFLAEHQRRDSMVEVLESLRFYETTLNSKFEPISLDSILTRKDFNGGLTLIFS